MLLLVRVFLRLLRVGGGIMYPIMQSIADAYESKPGPTARRAGAFLAIAVSQIDTIICTMFLTAMAGTR